MSTNSNLLPKLSTEFSTKTYWQEFFTNRRDAFEWYGDYNVLSDVLHKYSKSTDNILVTGCGNSKLSEDLYDIGYNSIVNIDISEVVIKQMFKRNREKRIDMKYFTMDVKEMSFSDEEFNVVLDKGTLDALFTDVKESTVDNIRCYFQQVLRVLTVSGRFICVSLAQQHIINELISFFKDSCFIRIHCIEQGKEMDSNENGLGARLPIFIFVLTKLKIKLQKPFLETAFFNVSNVEKIGTIEDLLTKVKEVQDYSIVLDRLGRSKLDEPLSVHMWRDAEKKNEPCYTITIVDGKSGKQGQYAIFIVPQGQETEWLYATDIGRRQLLAATGFKRLAIVTLHRGHVYESIEYIKQELSTRVMDFAPSALKSNAQVLFLTSGNEVGYRQVQYEGYSKLYGRYFVEDVQNQDKTYSRKLVYCDMMNFTQSEIRLVNDSSKKRKKKTKAKVIDHLHLMFDYQKTALASLCFLGNFIAENKDAKYEMLMIGVGGGSLPSFIAKTFPRIRMTCIELDEDILTAAKNWFALEETNNLRCIINDGTVFLQEETQRGVQEFYDVIMFDVTGVDKDGKNTSPPSAFLEGTVLTTVKTLLKKNGVLSVTVATNGVSRKKEVKRCLKKHFSCCYECTLQNSDVIPVFCTHPEKKGEIPSIELILSRTEALQKHVIRTHQGKLSAANFNLCDCVGGISDCK